MRFTRVGHKLYISRKNKPLSLFNLKTFKYTRYNPTVTEGTLRTSYKFYYKVKANADDLSSEHPTSQKASPTDV